MESESVPLTKMGPLLIRLKRTVVTSNDKWRSIASISEILQSNINTLNFKEDMHG